MSRPAEKKVKLTAFSSVSWIQVQSMFEFSAFGLDAFSPQRTTFSSPHTIDEIVSRLTELERICGKINIGNEATRRAFIDVFMQKIALEKGLFLALERPLASLTHHGSCEYVLLVPSPPTVVVIIVEAKAGDMAQGRAQLILQLVAAAVENASHGFVPSAYYGAVTTADYWVLVRYDPAKEGAAAWQEAELGSVLAISDGPRFDRAAVAKICESILWSIDTILPQVAEFQQKHAPTQRVDVAHMALSLRNAKERMEKVVSDASVAEPATNSDDQGL